MVRLLPWVRTARPAVAQCVLVRELGYERNTDCGGGRGTAQPASGEAWTWMETDGKDHGARGDPNLKISGQWL